MCLLVLILYSEIVTTLLYEGNSISQETNNPGSETNERRVLEVLLHSISLAGIQIKSSIHCHMLFY